MATLAPAKKRVLLVDDDASSLVALAQLLGDEFDVDVAHDGFEGYARALQSPVPDVVITDVDMPKMNGTTMATLIRERRRVPIIFVTALGGPLDVIKGIQAGARYYVTKPYDLADLEAKIHQALGVPSVPPEAT
jgi:DNA-binding response OmpR family regulator